MMLLYIVGNALEEVCGPKKFALVFFLGGIATFILSSPAYSYGDLIVGNSGAIFTVMAVLALINPLAYKLTLPYRFVFRSGKQVVSELSKQVLDKKNFLTFLFILFLIQFTIIMLYTTLIPEENVGHLGHFMGFIIGIIFGIAWSDRLKQVIKDSGKFVALGFFTFIFLTYAFYVILRIINPVSQNFIDDFLSYFNIKLFASEDVKCNNYCLEHNYDYGVVERATCTCMINLTVQEHLGA
jgi:hypothetical protein